MRTSRIIATILLAYTGAVVPAVVGQTATSSRDFREHYDSLLQDTQLASGLNASWRLYEGLPVGLWKSDSARLGRAVESVKGDRLWPNRDEYEILSLSEFPQRVRHTDGTQRPVPFILLPDPQHIDEEFLALIAKTPILLQSDPGNLRNKENPYRARDLGAVIALFSKIEFAGGACVRLPWPMWADACIKPGEEPHLKSPRLGIMETTPPGFNVFHSDCLHNHKAEFEQSLLYSRVIADGLWTNVQMFMGSAIRPGSHREFVFPLWESLGTVRDWRTDPLDQERVSPMSSVVSSPDISWELNGHSCFIQGLPFREKDMEEPSREYVVLPERFSSTPVPIACFFKAPTWKPFAEDYVIRMGIPKDTEGLRAVCVFMTATDAQLEEFFRTLGVPPVEQGADAK